MNYLFFFVFVYFLIFWVRAGGFGAVNVMLTPVFARFIVTSPRLYFYDHSFVNEDTSEVFLPPPNSLIR